MARGDGIDRTSARNAKMTAAKVGNAQAHNERQKESYVNQDIVPERTEKNAAPAGALAVADDTLYHRLRHGHHRLSTSCATPLPPTARERLTPWLTISRSADRPMGTGDAWGM